MSQDAWTLLFQKIYTKNNTYKINIDSLLVISILLTRCEKKTKLK